MADKRGDVNETRSYAYGQCAGQGVRWFRSVGLDAAWLEGEDRTTL